MYKIGDIVRCLYDSQVTAIVIGFADSRDSKNVFSDVDRFVMATKRDGSVISFLFNCKDYEIVDHVDCTEILQRIEEAKEA